MVRVLFGYILLLMLVIDLTMCFVELGVFDDK